MLARCPIDDRDGFFHRETRIPSAKNLASLLGVFEAVHEQELWVTEQRAAPDVVELLQADHDAAGWIVQQWRAAVVARFAGIGRALGHASP